MQDYKRPPQVLTRCPGIEKDEKAWVQSHYFDWIRAAKGGEAACSNFSISGPFAQWILLGTIAMRFEGKLLWDANKKEFANNHEANHYLKPNFRKGWKFVG
jgi:hypothetical protein